MPRPANAGRGETRKASMTKHEKGQILTLRSRHCGRDLRSGQSTVEYLLVVTAVIAVVIALATGQDSAFQKKLANTINRTTDGMEDMANRLMKATNPPAATPAAANPGE